VITIDTSTGPVGLVNMGVTAYLEVGGQRFSLESVRLASSAKDLITKWQRYAQTLNLQFQVSEGAQRYAGN
jgi:hypothetical protein